MEWKQILFQHWNGRRYFSNIGMEADTFPTLEWKQILFQHWNGSRYFSNIGMEADTFPTIQSDTFTVKRKPVLLTFPHLTDHFILYDTFNLQNRYMKLAVAV